METDSVLIGALIFIILILGSNFVMYVIARNWAKDGDSGWMKTFNDAISKRPENKSDKAMDELRKRMEEFEKKKNGE